MTKPLIFVSANVRGFKNEKKQKIIINHLKNKKAQIICLQETYLNLKEAETLQLNWKGKIFCSPGTTHKAGLLTFLGDRFENGEEIYRDERVLIIKAKLEVVEENNFFVINVYAPANNEYEKQQFLNKLDKTINTHVDLNSYAILAGDFNSVIDNNLDIVSGARHHETTVKVFNDLVASNNLVDSWRICHPTERQYTWKRDSPFTARRLDYVFTNDILVNLLLESEIIFMPRSDHRAIMNTFQPKTFPKGPSFYKFNNSLLIDPMFVSKMRDTIIETDRELEKEEWNPNDKWEMLKIRMKDQCTVFSQNRAQKRKQDKVEIERKLNDLENQLSNDPEDELIKANIVKESTKLESMLEVERRGAALRANIKWIEEGERNTAYFLGLEKVRRKGNTITSLRTKDGLVQTLSGIQREIHRYFQDLYKQEAKPEQQIRNQFHEQLKTPKLDETEADELEKEITIEELTDALIDMKNNSSPGIDGLTSEFYKTFWNEIKTPLFASYQYSIKHKQLSDTQTLGVTTLIHKGRGLPKNDLSNWRPITVTTVDYKILAKVIAKRLKSNLPNLISDSQTGFMKGRSAAHLIRQIDDIIHFSEKNEIPGYLFSIDFHKCFDSVSHEYIEYAFQLFGFKEGFRSMVATLTSKGKSCVNNGGWLTDFYSIERGLRQGCPLSPLSYLLVAELLALKVKQNTAIKGFKITNTQHIKILQYADDTTFLLTDIMDYREILSLTKQFTRFSGLRLNPTKSHIMRLNNKTKPLEGLDVIEQTERIKVLGIAFEPGKEASTIKENWETVVNKIDQHIKAWTKRNLSILGKIIVVKTFILSQAIYTMQSIGLPEDILVQINRKCFSFIWKRKYSNRRAVEKIKRAIMCSPIDSGGLNMINIQDMQESFYIKWLINLSKNMEAQWAGIPQFILRKVNRIKILEANTVKREQKTILGKIGSPFWRKAIQVWFRHSEIEINESGPSKYLWHNKDIHFQSNTLFFERWAAAGLNYTDDILKNDKTLTDYQEIQRKTGKYPSFMFEYNAIKTALNKKAMQKLQSTAKLKGITFKEIDVVATTLTTRNIRQLLTENKTIVPHSVTFWSRKLNYTITKTHWELAKEVTKEARLQVLQWKILHNIFPTSILLNKMGITESRNCNSCEEVDYIEHFFVNCKEVEPLWKEVTKTVNSLTGKCINISTEIALFGYFESKLSKKLKDNINHIILIAKMCISKFKYGKGYDLLTMFDKECKLRNI